MDFLSNLEKISVVFSPEIGESCHQKAEGGIPPIPPPLAPPLDKLFGMSKNQSQIRGKLSRCPPKITWEHSWPSEEANNALAQSNFRALPNEVILHIFKFLTVHDLGNVSLVCRVFKMLADQDEIWKLKTKCKFNCSSFIKLI
jgi:hypothetical protein